MLPCSLHQRLSQDVTSWLSKARARADEIVGVRVQEGRQEALREAVAELREGPRELVDLYNDYVCPWARWGLALEMVEVANYTDAAYVRQLWDVYLRQVL